MIINILGTDYEIKKVPFIENDMAGKTDFFEKKIYLIETEEQESSIVLKHEIMHAFFFEAGLYKYSQDEILVEFFALQFDKIKKLFETF